MIDKGCIEKAKRERESWPEWKRNCGNCDPAYYRVMKSLRSYSNDSEDN